MQNTEGTRNPSEHKRRGRPQVLVDPVSLTLWLERAMVDRLRADAARNKTTVSAISRDILREVYE